MSLKPSVSHNPILKTVSLPGVSDLEALKTNEFQRRRKLRLLQVREQSRDIAKKIRKNFNHQITRRQTQIDLSKRNEIKEQENKLQELQGRYEGHIENLGLSHSHANDEIHEDEVWTGIMDSQRKKALERGRKAIKELKEREYVKEKAKLLEFERKKLARLQVLADSFKIKPNKNNQSGRKLKTSSGSEHTITKKKLSLNTKKRYIRPKRSWESKEVDDKSGYFSSSCGECDSQSEDEVNAPCQEFDCKEFPSNYDLDQKNTQESIPEKDNAVKRNLISQIYEQGLNTHLKPDNRPKFRENQKINARDVDDIEAKLMKPYDEIRNKIDKILNANNNKENDLLQPSTSNDQFHSLEIIRDENNQIKCADFRKGGVQSTASYATVESDHSKINDCGKLSDLPQSRNTNQSDISHIRNHLLAREDKSSIKDCSEVICDEMKSIRGAIEHARLNSPITTMHFTIQSERDAVNAQNRNPSCFVSNTLAVTTPAWTKCSYNEKSAKTLKEYYTCEMACCSNLYSLPGKNPISDKLRGLPRPKDQCYISNCPPFNPITNKANCDKELFDPCRCSKLPKKNFAICKDRPGSLIEGTCTATCKNIYNGNSPLSAFNKFHGRKALPSFLQPYDAHFASTRPIDMSILGVRNQFGAQHHFGQTGPETHKKQMKKGKSSQRKKHCKCKNGICDNVCLGTQAILRTTKADDCKCQDLMDELSESIKEDHIPPQILHKVRKSVKPATVSSDGNSKTIYSKNLPNAIKKKQALSHAKVKKTKSQGGEGDKNQPEILILKSITDIVDDDVADLGSQKLSKKRTDLVEVKPKTPRLFKDDKKLGKTSLKIDSKIDLSFNDMDITNKSNTFTQTEEKTLKNILKAKQFTEALTMNPGDPEFANKMRRKFKEYKQKKKARKHWRGSLVEMDISDFEFFENLSTPSSTDSKETVTREIKDEGIMSVEQFLGEKSTNIEDAQNIEQKHQRFNTPEEFKQYLKEMAAAKKAAKALKLMQAKTRPQAPKDDLGDDTTITSPDTDENELDENIHKIKDELNLQTVSKKLGVQEDLIDEFSDGNQSGKIEELSSAETHFKAYKKNVQSSKSAIYEKSIGDSDIKQLEKSKKFGKFDVEQSRRKLSIQSDLKNTSTQTSSEKLQSIHYNNSRKESKAIEETRRHRTPSEIIRKLKGQTSSQVTIETKKFETSDKKSSDLLVNEKNKGQNTDIIPSKLPIEKNKHRKSSEIASGRSRESSPGVTRHRQDEFMSDTDRYQKSSDKPSVSSQTQTGGGSEDVNQTTDIIPSKLSIDKNKHRKPSEIASGRSRESSPGVTRHRQDEFMSDTDRYQKSSDKPSVSSQTQTGGGSEDVNRTDARKVDSGDKSNFEILGLRSSESYKVNHEFKSVSTQTSINLKITRDDENEIAEYVSGTKYAENSTISYGSAIKVQASKDDVLKASIATSPAITTNDTPVITTKESGHYTHQVDVKMAQNEKFLKAQTERSSKFDTRDLSIAETESNTDKKNDPKITPSKSASLMRASAQRSSIQYPSKQATHEALQRGVSGLTNKLGTHYLEKSRYQSSNRPSAMENLGAYDKLLKSFGHLSNQSHEHIERLIGGKPDKENSGRWVEGEGGVRNWVEGEGNYVGKSNVTRTWIEKGVQMDGEEADEAKTWVEDVPKRKVGRQSDEDEKRSLGDEGGMSEEKDSDARIFTEDGERYLKVEKTKGHVEGGSRFINNDDGKRIDESGIWVNEGVESRWSEKREKSRQLSGESRWVGDEEGIKIFIKDTVRADKDSKIRRSKDNETRRSPGESKLLKIDNRTMTFVWEDEDGKRRWLEEGETRKLVEGGGRLVKNDNGTTPCAWAKCDKRGEIRCDHARKSIPMFEYLRTRQKVSSDSEYSDSVSPSTIEDDKINEKKDKTCFPCKRARSRHSIRSYAPCKERIEQIEQDCNANMPGHSCDEDHDDDEDEDFIDRDQRYLNCHPKSECCNYDIYSSVLKKKSITSCRKIRKKVDNVCRNLKRKKQKSTDFNLNAKKTVLICKKIVLDSQVAQNMSNKMKYVTYVHRKKGEKVGDDQQAPLIETDVTDMETEVGKTDYTTDDYEIIIQLNKDIDGEINDSPKSFLKDGESSTSTAYMSPPNVTSPHNLPLFTKIFQFISKLSQQLTKDLNDDDISNLAIHLTQLLKKDGQKDGCPMSLAKPSVAKANEINSNYSTMGQSTSRDCNPSKIDPRLKLYVDQLLKMSRYNLNDYSVSSVSSVSISSSIVNVESNHPEKEISDPDHQMKPINKGPKHSNKRTVGCVQINQKPNFSNWNTCLRDKKLTTNDIGKASLSRSKLIEVQTLLKELTKCIKDTEQTNDVHSQVQNKPSPELNKPPLSVNRDKKTVNVSVGEDKVADSKHCGIPQKTPIEPRKTATQVVNNVLELASYIEKHLNENTSHSSSNAVNKNSNLISSPNNIDIVIKHRVKHKRDPTLVNLSSKDSTENEYIPAKSKGQSKTPFTPLLSDIPKPNFTAPEVETITNNSEYSSNVNPSIDLEFVDVRHSLKNPLNLKDQNRQSSYSDSSDSNYDQVREIHQSNGTNISSSTADLNTLKPRPPPTLTKKFNTRTSNDIKPHELSTIIEYDTLLGDANLSSRMLDQFTPTRNQAIKSEKTNSHTTAAACKFDKSKPENKVPKGFVDVAVSVSSQSSLGMPDSTLQNLKHLKPSRVDNTKDILDVRDISMRPFVTFEEYIAQNNLSIHKIDSPLLGTSMSITDLLSEKDFSTESDKTLPDIVAELMKRNIISKPFSSPSSDDLVVSDKSPELNMSSFSLNYKNSDNNSVNKFLDSNSLSSSIGLSRHFPELEDSLKTLGLSWAIPTLKKTEESIAISSSTTSNRSVPLVCNKENQGTETEDHPSAGFISLIESRTKTETATGKNKESYTSIKDELQMLSKKIEAVKNNVKRNSDDNLQRMSEAIDSLFRDQIGSNDINYFTSLLNDHDGSSDRTLRVDKDENRASGRTRKRTSTPVELFKSSTFTEVTKSINNISQSLFSNVSDLSSVKVKSTNETNGSDDDLTVPNLSLRFKSNYDTSPSSTSSL